MNNLIKIITVLANLVILYFIYTLKAIDCKCSETLEREYIFYYSIVHIFLTLLMLIVPAIFDKNKQLSILVKLIIGFGMIINVYCLYQYSQHLKSCDCSSENLRQFMEYYSYAYIFLLILMHLYLYDFYIKNKHLRDVIVQNTLISTNFNKNIKNNGNKN